MTRDIHKQIEKLVERHCSGNSGSKFDPLLTREETAKYMGLSNGTLEVWASEKRYNLPYIKLGKRAVRYRLSDVENFINSNVKFTKKEVSYDK